METRPGINYESMSHRMMRTSLRSLFMAAGLSVIVSHAGLAQDRQLDLPPAFHEWLGPGGEPLPFTDLDQIEEFLQTAKISRIDKIPEGITKPKQMTLAMNGIEMRAIFRDVDEYKRFWKDSPYGPQAEFRDQCAYECAAYRLSRLLHLPHVPPTVPRKLSRDDFLNSRDFSRFEKKEGTVQAWVEQAMTEKDRLANGTAVPNAVQWANQHQMMHVWDNLVYNLDRNQTNILIGHNWKIWFIDQTRAFRPFKALREPEKIRRCERTLWQRLQEVTDDEIRSELAGLLTGPVLNALLERRRLIVHAIQQLIEEKGEQAVLFDLK